MEFNKKQNLTPNGHFENFVESWAPRGKTDILYAQSRSSWRAQVSSFGRAVSTPVRSTLLPAGFNLNSAESRHTQAAVVKLEISPLGEDSFSVGGSAMKAMRYAVKVDIGGFSGVIAPIIEK